ncbi:MAG TPA: hypothetical protein VGR35_18485 [Tepidisphaeraceae bacterium]|nr:hypothetical protein [Tepidisphaeraceae bacterium]
MSKQKKVARITSPPNARGRTAKTTKPDASVPDPREGNVTQERLTEASRSMGKGGGGKRRGDRRDMSQTYTTTRKHAARGNNPRADVKTRKR